MLNTKQALLNNLKKKDFTNLIFLLSFKFVRANSNNKYFGTSKNNKLYLKYRIYKLI